MKARIKNEEPVSVEEAAEEVANGEVCVWHSEILNDDDKGDESHD